MLDAAKNTELVSKFEAVLEEWCGVLRHVVINSRAVNPDRDSQGLVSVPLAKKRIVADFRKSFLARIAWHMLVVVCASLFVI